MMSFSRTVSFLALLGISRVAAFEITIYDGVEQCSAESNTRYRILSDASDLACHNFEQPVGSWANCAQYNNGGSEGASSCDSAPLTPKSVRVRNNLTGRDHACEFYDEPDCPGSRAVVAHDGCLMPLNTLRSFRCHWDQMDEQPDFSVEANLACGSGMSANACVHDCECGCAGQNVECKAADGSRTCNPATKQNCEAFCICGNP